LYVVRGTRLFVTAQHHGSLYNEADYLRLLSDTHGFDLEVLTHNRDGILTKAQRRQLTRTGVEGIIGALVVAIGVIGGLLYTYPGELLPVLICTIGIIVIAAGVLIRSLARFNDSSRGTVNSVRGKLRKRVVDKNHDGEGRPNYTYWYDIDGLIFEVTRDGYGVLEESREYIIYYTPHGKHIVNIEPITQPKASALYYRDRIARGKAT